MTENKSIEQVAIVGAGTMGSGIALAALSAGLEVRLFDISQKVLDQAAGYLKEYLAKKDLQGALDRVQLTVDMAELAPAPLWLEAVPEKLELKRRTFRQMESLARPDSILATNTSTLSVTSIASGLDKPERVIGLHFFNPAAVMPLVEVVRTDASETWVLKAATDFARRLGKTTVQVKDSPGFIVNRVARPFYGEALRILGETGAEVELLDAVVESAGFPMGPFRLMDLIGVDVNLAATEAMYEQSGKNERYRPHPIQQQMVRHGLLGRKVGEGFYKYDGPVPARDPVQPPVTASWERAYVLEGEMGGEVVAHLAGTGIELVKDPKQADAVFVLSDPGQTSGGGEQWSEQSRGQAPWFCQTVTATLSDWLEAGADPRRLIGFDSLFFGKGNLATMQAAREVDREIIALAESLMARIGLKVAWLSQSPALVLPRLIAMLANEAAFAVACGVAPADVVDEAMELGVNYPRGPIAWGEAIGWRQVISILDHLEWTTGESRYEAAPLLRQWAEETM